ncbi:BnaCnng33460D [Brassica napus]|uniref:BnaCnng33460D protein n=1 Tax=Brassica napus TaxID=3708 RepID=A0A078J0H6_BRANA|nr:BnaCnng33460D [Brassica napus]
MGILLHSQFGKLHSQSSAARTLQSSLVVSSAMLGDIESFLAYPWGRESFLATLPCFLPPPDPTACKDTVTILSVQDILVVKADATLSVHLDLIPEREKHMWLEEVEDDRVTRFVEMMRSGEIFKPEDFPGGDRRFWVPEATINKCRKRKANEDNQGPSKFQFSGGKRTRSLIRMAKKKKPTASSPGRKKHSYALRSGDGNDTSEVVHPSDHELS